MKGAEQKRPKLASAALTQAISTPNWMLPMVYLVSGNNFLNRVVVSSRSIALAATAKANSSHSGPSDLGSIPFKRRNTMQAPSAARLLPSMNG